MRKIINIEHLTRITDLWATKTDWEELFEKVESKSLTHTYEWSFAMWKCLSGIKNTLVLRFRDESDNLLAIIPIVMENVVECNREGIIIQVLTYIDPFLTSVKHTEILDEFYNYINEKYPDWLRISFLEVDEQYPAFKILHEWGNSKKLFTWWWKSEEVPYLKVDGLYAEYLNKYGELINKRINKKRLRTAYTVKKYSSSSEITKGFEHLLEVDCQSWKYEEKSDICSRLGQLTFYETLTYEMAKKGQVDLFLLYILENNEPIAYEQKFIVNGRVMGMKQGYKEKYKSYSPGIVIRNETIKYYFEKGHVDYIDFWGEKDKFKMLWTDTCFNRYTFHIYASSNEALNQYKDDQIKLEKNIRFTIETP